jgi:hypothetical protein
VIPRSGALTSRSSSAERFMQKEVEDLLRRYDVQKGIKPRSTGSGRVMQTNPSKAEQIASVVRTKIGLPEWVEDQLGMIKTEWINQPARGKGLCWLSALLP